MYQSLTSNSPSWRHGKYTTCISERCTQAVFYANFVGCKTVGDLFTDQNTSLFSCPFKKDVQECGTMIDNMLINASFWLLLFKQSTNPPLGPTNRPKDEVSHQGNDAGRVCSGRCAKVVWGAVSHAWCTGVWTNARIEESTAPGLPPRAQTVSFPAPQVEKRRLGKYASR